MERTTAATWADKGAWDLFNALVLTIAPDEEQGNPVKEAINTVTSADFWEALQHAPQVYRDALADAYESGDVASVSRLQSEVFVNIASLPAGGGEAGLIGATRKIVEPIYKTNREATAAAKTLGYTKVNETVHDGQAVYRKGNSYITRDLDGHNGGAWKMADSVKNLESRQKRIGTFDINLVQIGN